MRRGVTDESRHPIWLGTLLVRLLVPVHVLIGAVMKFTTASPDALPNWMITAVQKMEWNPLDTPTMLPGEADELMLMGILKAILCLEFVAAGVMFFLPRLARPVGILILSTFIFVLLAEISQGARAGGVGIMDSAFSQNCSCFGTTVTIPVGVMLIVDAILLLGVIFFRPITKPLQTTPKWAVTALLVWCVLGIAAGLNPTAGSGEPPVPWYKLSANYWVGHSFMDTPLAADLDVFPSDFGPVEQTWVLYRKTCPACHYLFDEKYSKEITDRIVVAVHIPPGPDAFLQIEPREVNCPSCEFTELPVGPTYQYETPLEIFIDESGIITKVVSPRLTASADDEREI